jgi:MoaA/NifB/PqqE/SkfB family radical SAM enzyme
MIYQTIPITQNEISAQEKLKLRKPLVHEKCLKFDEKLSRNESIAIIQLQYNYVCNFKCQHCSIQYFKKQPNKTKRKLTIEDIKNLGEQADALGLAHIDITGGEPLLFKDLDNLIDALDASKFYLQCDTNGWLMNDERAQHLADKGIDKIQLSLDSLNAEEHDSFRRTPGAHKRAIAAIDSIKKAGLKLQLATVVTHQRLHSEEFKQFLDFAKSKEIAVSVCWPKPVGEWEGHYEGLPTDEDILYLDSLRSQYHLYEHMTPSYGRKLGCIAVKRMISITQYGDVMPCPWIYMSLGNILTEPLKDILERGMKYFGHYNSRCLTSNDKNFIDNYITQTYNQTELKSIEEILP